MTHFSDIANLCLVNFFLDHRPDFIVHRIKVWAIWRSKCRGYEIWSLVCEKFNGLACSVSRSTILLKLVIFGQLSDIWKQFLHQQNIMVIRTVKFNLRFQEVYRAFLPSDDTPTE